MNPFQTLTPGEAEATRIMSQAQSTALARMATVDAPTRTPAPPADTATPWPTWTVQPTATDAPTATGTPEPTHTATIAPTVTGTATQIHAGGYRQGIEMGSVGAILFVMMGAALLIGSTLFRRRR
jgi:hypothetical protein